MNQSQIYDALKVALGVSGPLAALIMKYTGLTQNDFEMWVSVILLIVPPVAAWGWGVWQNRNTAKVEAVAHMPVAEQRDALGKVSDAAKVNVAKDVEGVQIHVDTESPNTSKAVVELAKGPTPDVFPMIGGRREPSDHENL